MGIALTDAQAEEFDDLYEGEILELDGHLYTLYEKSDETNDLKLVTWDKVFKRNDDKYFMQSSWKSGSYWASYQYSYGDELNEVRKVDIIKTIWKCV